MAHGPREFERGSLELDHLHTRTTVLAGDASKTTGAPAVPTSRRARLSLRARRTTLLRSFGVIAVALAALLFAGGAMFNQAQGAPKDDPASNSVRAVFGAPSYGPSSGGELNANFAGIAATPTKRGYWVVASDGGVFSFGDAHFHGSTGNLDLAKPIVGMASTASGGGYWLAGSDGGVFAFGDANFLGSAAGGPFGGGAIAPVVAIARTPSGQGYWLLSGDGGVFAFGDATFHGSGTASPHRVPFIAMAPTRSGFGYYLMTADGGVYAFGDAHFAGSAVDGKHVATGIAVPSNGRGYYVARSDGSVVGFGGAASAAAPPDLAVAFHPTVAIASSRGAGAWLVRSYSDPPPAGSPAAPAAQSGQPSQDPFLKCTRAHESDSAGGYHAVSSDGLYHGAYQFLQSTWNNVARAAGRPDLVGVDPANASVAAQDQLALFLYHQAGAGPWGGRCA